MTVSVVLYKAVYPLRLQVPHRDALMVVIKVECQVLAPDAKADNAELRRLQVRTRGRHESLLSGGRRLPRRRPARPLPLSTQAGGGVPYQSVSYTHLTLPTKRIV